MEPEKTNHGHHHALFAAEHIAGRDRLHELTGFPPDLWEEMARCELFGVGIDPAFGGRGGDSRDISLAGMALAEYGGNLGIAFSFLLHELVARWFVQKFGTPAQKKVWLPELAAGRMTACFAVSEPKTGAHPRYMASAARPVENGYLLTGEKAYLTNGPMADLFIVVAATALHEDRKQFTAFLVPLRTAGLTPTGPMELPFLRPSPHGGIRLDDCPVGADQVIGEIGDAYESMVVPFRTIEDTVMAGPFAGALAYQVQALAREIRHQSIHSDDDLLLALGQMHADTEVMKLIALSAADLIEKGGEDTVAAATLSFRRMVLQFQDRFHELAETRKIHLSPEISRMAADISAAVKIASRVADIRLKKQGTALLSS